MKRWVMFGSFVTAMALSGCGGSNWTQVQRAEANVTRVWTDELLECVRNTSYGPTPSSRAIAIVTTAMYDAYAIIDPVALALHTSDESLTVGVGEEALDEAIAYAAFRTLLDLYPTCEDAITARMTSQGLDPDFVGTGLSSGAEIGNLAAQNVIDARANDGSNQAGGYADTSGYVPVNTVDTVNDPNHWQPVEFQLQDGTTVVSEFLTPHWGGVTPFALSSGSEFRCPPPAQYGTAEFEAETRAVVDYQTNITDEQKMIGEYWADGPDSETPPGHWILFAQHIAQRNEMSSADAAKLYFLVGNAVMDAGIAAWESKVYYDYVRPITAVRTLLADEELMGWRGVGQGIGPIQGRDWLPYQPAWFITPNFAEMPSGHSTFSSAAASVIRSYQGSDELDFMEIYATGTSHYEPGLTPGFTVNLYYPTLSSAAQASGISRLYGGIHFPSGNTEGLLMGERVAEKVWAKASRLFEGVR